MSKEAKNDTELSAEALATAKLVKKKAKFHKELVKGDNVSTNCIVPDPDNKIFKDVLPDDFSIDQVRKAQRIIHRASAGVLQGVSEVALEAFKDDPDLEVVSSEPFKMGYDTISYKITRERLSRNPSTGEEFVKYGSVRTNYETRATRQSGDMGIVKKKLHDLYKEVLGG